MSKFLVGDQVLTLSGLPGEVIGVDGDETWVKVATPMGISHRTVHASALELVPPVSEAWINIYPGPIAGYATESLKEANDDASSNRIGVVYVNATEGRAEWINPR